MTRIAAVLAAAVLGSGCIITSEDSQGTVNVYWDFVRNAPAQPGGFVIYDEDLVGSGNSACPQSGVELVDVTSPNGTASVTCTYGGVQGITFDNVTEGSRTFRVRGWRNVGGADRLVYDHSVTASVVGGASVDVIIDVEPVMADIDLVAFYTNVAGTPFTYNTCNEAQNPDTTYQLWDSFGTLVDEATVGCPAGASALALPIIIGTLDLDTYTTRLQGFTTFVDPVFDSCTSNAAKYLEFDHFTDHTGAGRVEIDLFTPPSCTPTP
jgi:hypothetical protein